jgi:GNAT superfamily N-acetyltransferase
MFWRLTRSEYEKNKGDGNKRKFKKLVSSGRPPGVLAYDGAEPVGWCAVASRADYPALARSRVLAPLDDAPVWSVTCFFIRRDYRNRGLSALLLQSAVQLVRQNGGKIIEGYPHDPKTRQADAFVWSGLAPVFKKCGFREVARRSPTRPIMRLRLNRI